MRRDRIVKAVDTLRDALQAAHVRELLRLARSGEQEEDVSRTQKVLLSYSVFTKHYQEFSQEEKDLMGYFGLNPLLDMNFWSTLIDGEQAVSRKMLADVDVGAYNVIFVMPRLRELLLRDTDQEELVTADTLGKEHKLKRLRLLVAERTQALTDPMLIITVIRSVQELYESLCGLRRNTGTALAIGSLDSGSAKSLDFFGAADVIEEMSRLLLDVWDRIKYSTEENYRYQIEVALMAAGFVGQINEFKAASAITEDQGQRITRMVAKSIEALFKSGAYTEDMDEGREVRASEVLAPKTEMLEYKRDERPRPVDGGLALDKAYGAPRDLDNDAKVGDAAAQTAIGDDIKVLGDPRAAGEKKTAV